LDSAAAANPTGIPKMAAGCGAPSSSSHITGNKDVGALPIATIAPPADRARVSSAPLSESFSSFQRAKVGRSRKVQITGLFCGKAGSANAMA